MNSVSTENNTTYCFRDLVDMPAFARMLESFFQATGIPNGVVEANGELLSLSSGDNVCSQFHRCQPEAEKLCRESNLIIMSNLSEGHVAGGLCKNGLMDYATPVIIEGQQLATLFLGQVLHTPPDMAFFKAQAERFGFDEKAYLDSIAAIPVISKERIESHMAVMVEIAKMLVASGLARIRQNSLEKDLSEHTERRIQLEDILNFSPVAIGWSNDEKRIEYINHMFTELFGYTLDDLPDLESWYRVAHPDALYRDSVVREWSEQVNKARDNGSLPPELETDITCKNGDIRRIIIHPTWVGRRRLISFSDITERWQLEKRTQARDAILEKVARGAGLPEILNAIVLQIEHEDMSLKCSILLLDSDGKHLHNGAAPNLPEFYNQAVDGLEIGIGKGSCGTAAYLGKRVIVEDIQTHDYWKPYTQLAKQANLGACWSEPIISSQGKVLGTFAVYHTEPKSPLTDDIKRLSFAANLAGIAIENRYTRDELERRAYSDYLTNLANRRYFLEQAEKELKRVHRHGGKLSIIMLDIDHFKKINDSYGHKIGDTVLKQLAGLCLSTIRDLDIVARIGGEEFAVLMPDTGIEQARQAAKRMRAAIASTKMEPGAVEPFHFTASFGVATLNNESDNIDILLNQADQSLYQAKSEGRNRVCSYHPK